jgi:hypothetical protein
MGMLNVSDITVPALLEKLRRREWLVPMFQRDFVWSVTDVIELVISIISSRPIGMATLWEQPDKPELELSPIFILDYLPEQKHPQPRYFAEVNSNPSKVYAILDGRQRCTAAAMAFGGLRALDGRFKYAGRYFLDVKTTDETERVVFVKEAEVRKKRFDTDASCVCEGLFPLASNQGGEQILAQWMRYLQSIRDPTYYAGGALPAPDELDRRDGVLKRAFEGIVETKLAVYVVPDNYHLPEICEIFETLNTTGTKVSTVDLIHSWLYSDTINDPGGPIQLRDWISEFGQKDGAIGWASANDRPELIAQIVTACYVALRDKPVPRVVSGSRPSPVSTIKAADLLATPTLHWKNIIHNDEFLAEFIGDFQNLVAGGYFPYSECPYPASAAIYVALRWHYKFDGSEDRKWGRQDLDVVFRAFFWRNALAHRYDQGFLTQVSTDIKQLKEWLAMRGTFSSANEWATTVQKQMDEYMSKTVPLPEMDDLVDLLTDARPAGALQKALTLPMIAGARKDLINPALTLAYPAAENVELHHIYPKGWCNKTKAGELADLFDKEKAGRDWVDSVANLMPLSRRSNNEWKAKLPGQLLVEKKLTFEQQKATLKSLFIDEACFRILLSGPMKNIREFWTRRAKLIAQDLIDRTSVVL